jgi:hypothetical protein
MPERKGVRADAGSYAAEPTRMQAVGRFLGGDRHVTVSIGGQAPTAAAPSAQHHAIGKIRDAGRTQQKDAGGVRCTPPGRLSRSEPVQERNGLNKL